MRATPFAPGPWTARLARDTLAAMDDAAFSPGMTTWHVTWGTYGTRLHYGAAPTVRRVQNRHGDPFIESDPPRYERVRQRLKHPPVRLSEDQRRFVQQTLPTVCDRGGWLIRVCAAKPDHVHVLLDITPSVHGEKARRLMKRWITQAMNARWPPGSGRPGSLKAGAGWWAEEGSNRAVHDLDYLRNATIYVRKQRLDP